MPQIPPIKERKNSETTKVYRKEELSNVLNILCILTTFHCEYDITTKRHINNSICSKGKTTKTYPEKVLPIDIQEP